MFTFRPIAFVIGGDGVISQLGMLIRLKFDTVEKHLKSV